MPSFDIVSEIDKQEIDNALNQARKELATRFDFKNSVAKIEEEKDKIILTAEDASRLRGCAKSSLASSQNAGSICATSINRSRQFPRLGTRARN